MLPATKHSPVRGQAHCPGRRRSETLLWKKPVQAGAATRDISPVTPVQLGGYPHVPRVSTGVHDPLLVSALFLNNGTATVLLCALDLLMLNANVARRFRRNAAAALGIPEAGVLISCTHTHSAPFTLDYLPFSDDPTSAPTNSAYLADVEKQIIEAGLAKRNGAASTARQNACLDLPPMPAALAAATVISPTVQPIQKPAFCAVRAGVEN